MNRRDLLKGMAAAPLLPQTSFAQTSPKRFVFVLEGNGVNPGNLLSETTRSALNQTANIPQGTPLISRLYRHDSPITVNNAGLSTAPSLRALSSLEDHCRVVLGLSSKTSGGGHTSNYGALSCAPSGLGKPSHATIDHVLSQAIGGQTPFDAVRLGIHPEVVFNYNTCAQGANEPLPIVCDIFSAYSALFGSVATGTSSKDFTNKSKLLDFMSRDTAIALAGFNGPSGERRKIEAYVQAIESLKARQGQIAGLEDELRAVAPNGPENNPIYNTGHQLKKLEVMFDLSTAALIGGLTNVVVLASGTGERGYNINYTDIGRPKESSGRHGICHGLEYGALTTITERHVNLVADMANKLRAIPEGNGTMLDNTVIIFGSDNGEKHHSLAEEWPCLLVGGNNMGLSQGNSCTVYPSYGNTNNRQLSNMYNTLGHLAGTPISEFGIDSNRITSGPLQEILG